MIKNIFVCGMTACILFSCKKDTDTATLNYTVTTYQGSVYYNPQLLPNATLYFYRSQDDLLLGQNVASTKTTDANGVYSATEKVNNPTTNDLNKYYYVDAQLGQLNTKRYYKKYSSSYSSPYQLISMSGSGKNGKDQKGSGSLSLYLSSTPTQLTITVYHLGAPVSGATVKLYKSESDYNNDVTDATTDPVTGVTLPSQISTDSNGQVYFSDLEPKKYWFKITSGSLNNSTGTISTDDVLPDDMNINTQVSVGIN